MAVRAVLWDLDGTLLDSNLSIRDTMNRVLAERGLGGFTKAELDALIGKPLRAILALKSPDRDVVEAMTHRYRIVYGESGWMTVRTHAGLESLIAELRSRGVAHGVVTSKGQLETELLLDDLGISHLFDHVVGDDDNRPLKPDPAPVVAGCEGMGVVPGAAVMVGDTEFDVRAGRAAGTSTIGVLWGNGSPSSLREAGAHHVVGDVRALRRLLLGLHKA